MPQMYLEKNPFGLRIIAVFCHLRNCLVSCCHLVPDAGEGCFLVVNIKMTHSMLPEATNTSWRVIDVKRFLIGRSI